MAKRALVQPVEARHPSAGTRQGRFTLGMPQEHPWGYLGASVWPGQESKQPVGPGSSGHGYGSAGSVPGRRQPIHLGVSSRAAVEPGACGSHVLVPAAEPGAAKSSRWMQESGATLGFFLLLEAQSAVKSLGGASVQGRAGMGVVRAALPALIPIQAARDLPCRDAGVHRERSQAPRSSWGGSRALAAPAHSRRWSQTGVSMRSCRPVTRGQLSSCRSRTQRPTSCGRRGSSISTPSC